MRFLFISNSKHRLRPSHDASTRYRCLHHAENLREMGHQADVCTQQDFGYHLSNRYDVFVFHRPRYSHYLEFLLNHISRRGALAIADYDDLLFTPEYATESPTVRNGQASEKIALKSHQNYRRALQLFDHITTSTTPLARFAKEAQPTANISVIHNGYSHKWLLEATNGHEQNRTPLAGYFPGTKSHDRDFGLLTPALDKYLDSASWKLFIAGPLALHSKTLEARTQRSPHVPFHRLAHLITRCDASIAPLEQTMFNQCKSSIKFIESAILGVPVIASPIPDMLRFSEGGPLLAHTPEEFIEYLDMLADPETRAETSNKQRTTAITRCASVDQTKKLISCLSPTGCREQAEFSTPSPSSQVRI